MKHGIKLLYHRLALCLLYLLGVQEIIAVSYTNILNYTVTGVCGSTCNVNGDGQLQYRNTPGSGSWNGSVGVHKCMTTSQGAQIVGVAGSEWSVHWGAYPIACASGGNTEARSYPVTFVASHMGVLNITVDIQGGPSQGPPPVTTNHFVKTCVKNDSSFPMTFSLSSAAGGGTEYTTFTVPPNSTACGTAGPFSSKREVFLNQLSGPLLVPGEDNFTVPDHNDDFTEWTEGYNGAAPAAGYGSPGGTPGGTPVIVPTNAPSNIDFTGIDGAAKDSTLKQGFSALREGLINGFSMIHEDAQDMILAQNSTVSQLSTLNTKATAMDTKLGTIASDTTSIKNSATAIATSTATAATKLGTIDTTLTASDTKLGQIKTATEGLQTNVNAVNTSLTAIKTAAQDTSTKLDTGNTKLGEIKTGIDAVNAHHVVSESKLETIKTTLTDMRIFAVDAANADNQIIGGLSGIQSTLNAANGIASTSRDYLGSIDGKFAGINTRLDTANGHNATHTTLLTGIGSTLSDFYEDSLTMGDEQHMDSLAHRALTSAGNNQLTNANANLRAITNMLGTKHLTSDEINAYKDTGNAAGVAAFAGMGGIRDGIASPASTSTGAGSSWTINVAGFTFDCNPLNHPGMASIAVKTRLALTWFVTALFLYVVWGKFQEYIQASSMIAQTNANDADILGVSVGQLSGPVFAAIICAALATLPVFVVSTFATWDIGGWSAQNPFNNFTGGAIGDGLYLANAFLPLDAILVAIVSYFVVTLSMSIIYGVAVFTIKWLFA